jgi:hypothetical protein
MPQYKAPVRDIQFVLHEVFNAEAHYDSIPAYAGTNRELIDGVIEAAADFCETNCRQSTNQATKKAVPVMKTVASPRQKALKKPTRNTSNSATHRCLSLSSTAVKALPGSLGIVVSEMVGTANWSWGMYPGLSHGATRTIEHHGSAMSKRAVPQQTRLWRVDGYHVLDRSACRF